MTSLEPKVTGELRKWRLDRIANAVIGEMHNDIKGIYYNGEEAVIVFERWEETPTYFLAVTKFSAVKCPKNEEIRNGHAFIDPA